MSLGNRDIEEFPELVELIGPALAEEPAAAAYRGRCDRRWLQRRAGRTSLAGGPGQGLDCPLRNYRARAGRSGIGNLKVKFNKVFGYFIEVTKSNLHLVPPEYTRKQTISTGERYITAELKEYEDKVLGAEEKIWLAGVRVVLRSCASTWRRSARG